MPTPDEIAKLAKGLTADDRACLLDLAGSQGPWRIGNATWGDHASRLKFYEMGLLDARFPNATPGDSGLQHWTLNERGLAVRSYLLEQPHAD